MSLVAYGSSSDEENSSDGEIDAALAVVTHCFNTNIFATTKPILIETKQNKTSHVISDSDDDDDDDDDDEVDMFFARKFGGTANSNNRNNASSAATDPLKQNFGLNLPKPQNAAKLSFMANEDSASNETSTDDASLSSEFSKLPPPKYMEPAIEIIEEENDEFLTKKETDRIADVPSVKSIANTTTTTTNTGKVKITIPSLKEFRDVDLDIATKSKNKLQTNGGAQKKSSGLLSLLPVAKSEQNFAKNKSNDFAPNETITTSHKKPIATATEATAKVDNKKFNVSTAFVPNVIKTQRVAINTECVDGIKTLTTHKKNASIKNKTNTTPTATQAKENTNADVVELSDNDSEPEVDFFSLNATEEKLPEVSVNEINAMVAKRAAKMSETTNKYLNTLAEESVQSETQEAITQAEALKAEKRQQSAQLNSEAMEALVGRKRRRKEENIDIIDISGEEVLPNRDEWMRTALTTSTSYQPTGVLVDEEPAAGTRRKHQITYLAHKAKANEAELQAMWSANRHNRRATQSKYGF